MSLPSKKVSAETRYREAFERLKTGRPELLPPNTPVSQNNVAKEAGSDPSALRQSRYSALIREIQAWVEINTHRQEARIEKQLNRKAKETVEAKLKRLTAERDDAQSQLISAHRQLLELLKENASLQAQIDARLPPITPLRA
jgi:hypothetical protein